LAHKIMIIRHAEKPGVPPPAYGVDPTGAIDKESLIVLGWQRVGALACLFSPWGAAAHPGLAVPTIIYATNPAGKSQRPVETVSAVASLLNIETNFGFNEGQEADLAAAAGAAEGPVLIGWHHQKIPAIANAIIGDATTCPQHWPASRFDVVWVFDRRDQVWGFTQIPQLLLIGDQPTPIPTSDKSAAVAAPEAS
jgi:hypothetical protein